MNWFALSILKPNFESLYEQGKVHPDSNYLFNINACYVTWYVILDLLSYKLDLTT